MFLEKLRQNDRRHYFYLYSLISIAYGFVISELGPLIPYLAAKYHLPETAFGFFFMCRSISFTLGNLSAKFLHKWFSFHQLLAIGLVGCAIPHVAFPFFDSIDAQGGCIALSSIACGLLEIYLSLALLDSHRGNDESYWLQLNHGLGGIGCFLSPFIIRLMEIHSYIFIGLFSLVPIFFLLRQKSPELYEEGPPSTSNNPMRITS